MCQLAGQNDMFCDIGSKEIGEKSRRKDDLESTLGGNRRFLRSSEISRLTSSKSDKNSRFVREIIEVKRVKS